MAKKKWAALMSRVSTPQQRKLGLESQIEILKKCAQEDGYEVPKELIFQEQTSGFDKNKPIRKSLRKLMNAVEEGKVEVCYIYEASRISRDPFNLVERVHWFNDHKIPIYIYNVHQWTLDRFSKEENKEAIDYIFNAARYVGAEIETMKGRIKRTKDMIAAKGLYMGHLSDGYCVKETEIGKEIKIDKDREAIIKRIFDLYERGNTIDKIAEILNTDGVPTANSYRLSSPKFKGYEEMYRRKGSDVSIKRTETQWQGSTISNYLSNQWYIGIRKYNEEKYHIDSIIEKEQWDKVQALKEENAISFRSKKESTKHTYLLSGLLFCGKCGRRMYGHYTGLNNHYYCSSAEEGKKCGLRGVNKENIEAAIHRLVQWKSEKDILGFGEGVVHDFFKGNPNETKELKKELEVNKKRIAVVEKERNIANENLIEAARQATRNHKDPIMFKIYSDQQYEYRQQIEDCEKEKQKILQENIALEKRINSRTNLLQIDAAIRKERDLQTLKCLFAKIIDNITVFNYKGSTNVIRTNFIDGDVIEFLYSYPKLKQNIVLVPQNWVYYDEDLSAFTEGGVNGIVDVEEFFDDQNLRMSFDRLEEPSDKAKEQNAKYKEYRKKYNNGLPTCVPFIIKDAAYEEICLRKKHLYNRKYKIKKHKKLTDITKIEMLEEIDKELKMLSLRIKYLSRTEALKEYEKQKKSKK